MAHYAKVNNGVVTEVIVAESDFFDTFVDSSPGEWIQTSYNTSAGVHTTGGTPLRKNFAGVGYTYDETRDAFIPPKTYASWVLDEDACIWKAPKTQPNDNKVYTWNESITDWQELSS
jgi:hypothetical protein